MMKLVDNPPSTSAANQPHDICPGSLGPKQRHKADECSRDGHGLWADSLHRSVMNGMK